MHFSKISFDFHQAEASDLITAGRETDGGNILVQFGQLFNDRQRLLPGPEVVLDLQKREVRGDRKCYDASRDLGVK